MADRTLDCQGLYCPLPVVYTAKELRRLDPGQTLLILATDPGAAPDLADWCAATGNELVSSEKEGAVIRIVIRRRLRAAP